MIFPTRVSFSCAVGVGYFGGAETFVTAKRLDQNDDVSVRVGGYPVNTALTATWAGGAGITAETSDAVLLRHGRAGVSMTCL